MDDPGSFADKINSPIPHLGPDDNNLISFAILYNEIAICFKAPCASTNASCAAIPSNLFVHPGTLKSLN